MTVRSPWPAYGKLLVGASLLGVGVFLFWRFRAFILPLVIAGISAYILAPVVGWAESRLRLGRGPATVLAFLLMLGFVALVPVLVVPALIDQYLRLNLNLRATVLSAEAWLGQGVTVGGYTLDLRQVLEQLVQSLRALGEPSVGTTLGIAFDVLGVAVWAVFILVATFYLTKDAGTLRDWIDGLPPEVYREDFRRLRHEIDGVWRAFLRGQLTLALVVALLITVLASLLGLPYALALGALAGVLEFLPSLGHGLWLLSASLLTLAMGSTWIPLPHWGVTLLLIGLHLIFQQVDLNFLIPRFVGRRMRLHPLVVIAGILAGAMVAGVLGILLAAPTIATARVLGRYGLARLFDVDPFEGASEAIGSGPAATA